MPSRTLKNTVPKLPTIQAPPGVRVPKYRRHRASGQAVVTLSGRDHYLGPYGCPESCSRYTEAVGRWLANGRQAMPEAREAPRSVTEVLLPFVEDCVTRFTGRRGDVRLIHRVKTVASILKRA